MTLIISFFAVTANASELSSKLKGKILLQVEQNGEAWYVNPADEKRYFMGRPDDAFSLMRSLGVGISNDNLQKIQIADINLSGVDDDNDGLSNMIEDSIGTDKSKNDSDNDGYSDKDEILNGYNPNSAGKMNIDKNFAIKQAGKILLQVEQNGEAWYVNPGDNKRYFLGRPADAFNVMRSLGLGITDNNLSHITQNQSDKNSQNLSQITECAEYPDKLDSCSEYTCTFTHMLTGDEMTREIKGIVNGKCLYTEEMPNNGRMDCEYTESMRKAVAQYYRDVIAAESIGTSVNTDLGSDDVKTTYTINGKEVESPLQEAFDNGQCVVSGYGDNDK
jgi:hypothetical protein